jgi:hypothetical protein
MALNPKEQPATLGADKTAEFRKIEKGSAWGMMFIASAVGIDRWCRDTSRL